MNLFLLNLFAALIWASLWQDLSGAVLLAGFAIGFGCTGGKHRSVTLAEKMADALAHAGWPVSKRHRELERRAHGASIAAGADALTDAAAGFGERD